MKHITPDRLAADFGPRSKPAREGVLALNQALQADRCAEAETAVHLWQSHVSRALGRQSARFDAAMGRLARYYGLPLASDPARLLFALQTWYALIVERLLQRVLTHAGRRSAGEWPNHPLAWYRFAGTAAIEKTVGQVVERMRQYDPGGLYANPAHGTDLLKTLYQELFPRSLRHALGEYYTPDWLAEHVLDQLGYHGDAQRRVLDPACGSGTFLVRAIGRLRKACQGQARDVLYRRILQNVAGLDLHPLAVMTARANYLIAIADLLPEEAPAEVPVYWCDSILDERPGPDAGLGRFDFVMGNPPWVAWDNLPDAYRQATKPLWERYGLFSLSGSEARHGGGKKDLAMLMVYRSIDRYLQDGGRLGMVLTQTLFQSKGAGDGFRRFRLGADGPWLRVLQVDDFVAMRPFGDAANWTSTIVLEKGARTQYPVPYVKWSAATAGASPAQAPYWARPIEQDRPSSPWLVSLDRAAQPAGRIGPSDYTAHLGANSGGANSVYWLEILGKAEGGVQVRNLARCGKRDTEAVSTVIEPDLLYPLVRWGDVRPWSAVPSACLLLAQDVVSRTGLDQRHLERELPRSSPARRRVGTDRCATPGHAARDSAGNVRIDRLRHGRRSTLFVRHAQQYAGEPPGRCTQRKRRQRIRHAQHSRLPRPAAIRPGRSAALETGRFEPTGARACEIGAPARGCRRRVPGAVATRRGPTGRGRWRVEVAAANLENRGRAPFLTAGWGGHGNLWAFGSSRRQCAWYDF
ncbi:MAG: N-6 DNA methylase [Thermoguttaceae bacterium]